MKCQLLYFGYNTMKIYLRVIILVFIHILFISTGLPFTEDNETDTSLADSLLKEDSKSISKQDSSLAIIDTASDTTVLTRGTSDSTAGITDSSIQTDEPEIDTSYRVWNNPFWSFGIGWELGSMPVFDSWKSGLPKAFSDLTEIPDTLDSLIRDSLRFSFTVNSDPGHYYVNFPVHISFTPLTRDDYYLSIKLLFSWMYKRLEASAISDSIDMIIKSERKLAFLSLSLGTFFNYSIPSKGQSPSFP